MIKVYGFFYLLVIFNFIFYNRKKAILIGVIITWAIANIADRGFDKVFSENFTDLYSGDFDSSIEEYMPIGKINIDSLKIEPEIIYVLNDSLHTKFFQNDKFKIVNNTYIDLSLENIAISVEETKDYIALVKKRISVLNKVKSRMKFKNNKSVIENYITYYNAVNNFYERKKKGEISKSLKKL